MPVIWIPALLRDLTEGEERVAVPGRTLRQAIDELETRHPGLKARLLDGDQLSPDIAVVVDGYISHLRLPNRFWKTVRCISYQPSAGDDYKVWRVPPQWEESIRLWVR